MVDSFASGMRGDDQDDPTVGSLSEGAILREILRRTSSVAQATVGPGDDAAVLAIPGQVVATTDTLVHGPDFRLAWSGPQDLGWKSAAVNIADVAAMGAAPSALLVALAMPDQTRLSFVTGLARGLQEACDALAPGCGVVGGDLTVSSTLTVAVTALGSLGHGAPILRSGARPGDVVAICGDLGWAGWGLDILFSRFTDAQGVPVAVRTDELTGDEQRAVRAQLRPVPPVAAAPGAAVTAHAMMDVSDGLVLDARRMAAASEVTIDFSSSQLQDDGAPGPTLQHVLTGGEDHALLAAFPAGALAPGFRPIGVVRESGVAPVLLDGAPISGRSGWDPYRDWDSGSG